MAGKSLRCYADPIASIEPDELIHERTDEEALDILFAERVLNH